MESKSLFHRRIPKIEPLYNKTKEYNHGKCGGRNLGNTCYMNSSIACLSNCSELTSYFLSGEYNYEKEINDENKHGTRGSLPKKWHDLLENYWMSNISAGILLHLKIQWVILHLDFQDMVNKIQMNL